MKLFRSMLALAVIGGLVLCVASGDAALAQKGKKKGTAGKVDEDRKER